MILGTFDVHPMLPGSNVSYCSRQMSRYEAVVQMMGLDIDDEARVRERDRQCFCLVKSIKCTKKQKF